MASTVEGIDQKSSDTLKGAPSGPPPAKPKPRSAADTSLFSSVGQAANQAGQDGMGAEGGSPQLLTMQGMALVQRGVQMLNLANPQNPGLVAILADLMGRLQAIIPQLVSGPAAAGGMGMFPNQMGMGQPPTGAAPPMGAPPMGAPPIAGPPIAPPTALPPQ